MLPPPPKSLLMLVPGCLDALPSPTPWALLESDYRFYKKCPWYFLFQEVLLELQNPTPSQYATSWHRLFWICLTPVSHLSRNTSSVQILAHEAT